MEKLTEMEKKFFEMAQSKGIKKISLNLSSDTFEKIDELAGLFKITKTLVLESVIGVGLNRYLDTIESANKKIKKGHPENKNLDVMLENIAKFRKKWNLQ